MAARIQSGPSLERRADGFDLKIDPLIHPVERQVHILHLRTRVAFGLKDIMGEFLLLQRVIHRLGLEVNHRVRHGAGFRKGHAQTFFQRMARAGPTQPQLHRPVTALPEKGSGSLDVTGGFVQHAGPSGGVQFEVVGG